MDADGTALAASESRLRALFETTSQGVAIMQLVRGPSDTVVDAEYVEVNPAFERLTGMDRASVVGRRSSGVFPLDFAHWQPRLATIRGTDGPERFETFFSDVGRWFSCYAAPLGEPDGFVMFFDDVSERKRRELQQAFLLTLSDALRPLTDAAEIQQTAARVLGEHLAVSRAMYADVEGGPGAEVGILRGQYHRADSEVVLPLFPERYGYGGYGERVMALRRRGATIIVTDVATDERFEANERAAWVAGGVRAAVTVALVKGGRFVADFGVQSAAPRDWTPDEVALVEETAERTWAAVERARAEAALRESEARYRMLFDTMGQGYCNVELVRDADGRAVDQRYVEFNPAFERIFGIPVARAQGRTASEVFPGLEPWWTESLDRIARAGTPERLEHEIVSLGRWYEVQAFPHGADRLTVLFEDITPRKEAEAARREAQSTALEEAERLTVQRTAERDVARWQLLEAEEVERRRLARELHDEAGQHLTAIGLGLQTLSDMAAPGSEVDRRAAQLRELVATMSRELHAIAVRLRPKSLDDFGLAAALDAYVAEWSRQTQIAVDVHAQTGAERLPGAIESAVYRVVQEALTNVARHSGAARASVIVERRDGQVHAIIEDDGRGFDADAVGRSPRDGSGGLGLRGIQERAALLGGSAHVESTPNGGTTVFVRIPLGTLLP